jgi:hypothetical protein
MKKTITNEEYEQIMLYKSMNDQLKDMGDKLFDNTQKILGVDDKGWLTDYFDNNDLDIAELLYQLEITIK